MTNEQDSSCRMDAARPVEELGQLLLILAARRAVAISLNPFRMLEPHRAQQEGRQVGFRLATVGWDG